MADPIKKTLAEPAIPIKFRVKFRDGRVLLVAFILALRDRGLQWCGPNIPKKTTSVIPVA